MTLGASMAATALRTIGHSVPKPDAWLKATGTATYAGDVRLAGMLEARVLRSLHPHARIVSIDTSAAEALPGVYAVITGRDVPEARIGNGIHDRHALARERVIYVGEPVAAVAALDEETAERALQLIEVQYEPLPAVFDLEEALLPGSPIVHPDLAHYEGVEELTAMLCRPEYLIKLKMAVRRDGTMVALDADMLCNSGAIDDYGPDRFTRAASLLGPYHIPHARIGMTAVYTNTSPSGHVRA